MAESITSLRLRVDSTDIVNAEKDLNNLTKASGNTEKSTNNLSRSFASLSTVLGTVGVAALTHEFVKIADEMKLLDSRLKMVSASTAEYVSQKKELLAISKETYSLIADITTLYTKLDPALKSLGATTKDVNNITESFAKGLKIGGAGAAEAASATLQFAQAMGSGVLRGEEFNAIAEASPKLMKYLAEGLGVPQTALRKMAMEGELSAGRVSAALLKMTTQINEDFTQIPMTVGMATTNLKNDLMTSIEQFDKTTGATKALAETIAGLSVDLTKYGTDITTFFVSTSKFIKDHNEALRVTASLIGGVATAYYGFIAGGAIVTGLRNITTAVYALRTSMIALQASSPILLAISVALGVATAAYLAHDDALEKKNYSTINSIEALTKSHDDLLKKRKEIQSDKFALDKTQKKETAIVDGELKKIENRLNAIGTARSNNVAKAKKEAEELIKSAKALEENAKKLAPPAKAKKEKKIGKSEDQKEAEKLAKEEAEQERKIDHDLNQSKLSNISKITIARQESETDVENASIQADTDNQIRKQLIIDGWKTELEKLNEYVLDEYDFVSKMFPDGIPQEWFDNVNNRFKDLKENVSEMDFSASIGFEPENLDGAAKAIASIGKSTSKLSDAEKQYQKNKDKTGVTAEELAKNEEDHTKNQLLGYAAIAGSMSSMFEEGSVAAERMIQIQQILGIIEAGVAVAKAGQGDPYTAIPRAISMAALMSQFVQGFGGGGGGGAASEGFSSLSKTEQIERQYDPTIDRLDKQIELLESIDKNGSAQALNVAQSAVTFEKEVRILIQDSLKSIAKGGTLDKSVSISQAATLEGQIGIDIYKGKSLNKNMIRDLDSFLTFASNASQNLAYFAGNKDFERQISLDTFITNVEGVISNFALSMGESVSEMSDAKDTFKDVFDSITGTTYFASKDLQKAYSEVNTLIGKSSLADYLKNQISAIEKVETAFGDQINSILNMSNDFETQVSATKMLNELLGTTFEAGTADAIDFINSIELVGESLSSSTENIKNWNDSLKTQDELLSAQGKSVGISSIPSTLDELNIVANRLMGGIGGLTNEELSYLQAVKEKIDSSKSEIASIKDISSETKSLEDRYSSLGTTTEQIRDKERLSVDSTNLALLNSIFAREDELSAINATADIQKRILEFGLSSREKELAIASDTDDTLLRQLYLMEDSKQASMEAEDQLKSLSDRLYSLTSTKETDRAKELSSALNDINKSILNQIYAQEDLNELNNEIANKQKEITDERIGLESTLFNLTHSLNEQRSKELLTLDVTNRSIQTAIWAEEDRQKAIEESNSKLDETNSIMTSVFSSIVDFVKELRGETELKNVQGSFNGFISAFNAMQESIINKAFNAEEMTSSAIESARGYLDSVTSTAESARDIAFANAMVASKFAGVNTGNLTSNAISPTPYIQNTQSSSSNDALLNELRLLRQLNTSLVADSGKQLAAQRALVAQSYAV